MLREIKLLHDRMHLAAFECIHFIIKSSTLASPRMLMVARTGIMNIPFGHVISYQGHAFLSMLKCLDHVIGGSVIYITFVEVHWSVVLWDLPAFLPH